MTGTEQVLIEDWCQQYPSHSIGALAFGADGALYVSGRRRRELQLRRLRPGRRPAQPLRRPAGRRRRRQTPPTAEGGALRSQDLRTTGDPTSLDGAVLRVDPATGAALPDNPLASRAPTRTPAASSPTACATRSGSTIRPGTNEIWIGDVGWNTWEEINRIADPLRLGRELRLALLRGRPARQGGYDGANLNICENLYAHGRRRSPRRYYTYNHSAHRSSPARPCPTGSSSIAGLAFYRGRHRSRRVRRRALLRRLLARLHLGDVRRAATACPNPATGDVSSPRGEPGRPADRPGRRPLLRRLRRRHDPPHPLLRANQPPIAVGDGDPDERARAAAPSLRRQRLERSRWATAHLRLGPRRRRRSSTTRLPRSRRYTYAQPGAYTAGCA